MESQEKTTIQTLEYKINLLRFRMVYNGQLKGLSHPHTIKCSQELDSYLNHYNQAMLVTESRNI